MYSQRKAFRLLHLCRKQSAAASNRNENEGYQQENSDSKKGQDRDGTTVLEPPHLHFVSYVIGGSD